MKVVVNVYVMFKVTPVGGQQEGVLTDPLSAPLGVSSQIVVVTDR